MRDKVKKVVKHVKEDPMHYLVLRRHFPILIIHLLSALLNGILPRLGATNPRLR